MSIRRVWLVFAREVTMGPRTMMALWILIFPLLITFIVRLVFGGLIDPAPRLGIVDYGSSSIATAVETRGDIDLALLDSEEELRRRVEANNLDAGLILPAGFDEAVRSGDQPELQFFVGGESLASNRIVLAVTAIDLVREIAGQPAPVSVQTTLVGEGTSVPMQDRIVPMLVLLSVALAGIFLPGASIIQERIHHTIDAVLTTPTAVADVFVAKGVVGFLISLAVGVLTLLINGGFTAYVAGNIAVISVGALMSVQLGLILGATVGDIQTMFTVWKGGGIFLFAPAILFLFPGVPDWIARCFPTYYFLGPLYEMTVEGAALDSVAVDLAIGVAISVALAVGVGALARRMEMKLAAA